MKYPYHPNIHNFGNVGIGGKIHAELAPLFTQLIDKKAYNGRNIRQELINSIKLRYHNNITILDFCCGTGFSTDSNGIDTSPEFINKAKRINNNNYKKFIIADAENYNPNYNVDIITCMFAFHEMPKYAHYKILDNAIKIAKKEIIILDISPKYKPSYMMRTGEPFIDEYIKTIDNTLTNYKFKKYEYIPSHVSLWIYKTK